MIKKILPFLAIGILVLSGLGAAGTTQEDTYDMVIIAPSEFSDELQPLIDHKNSLEIETIFKSTEEIYNEYDAYDEAEEIKYFIKDAIEDWGIDYVLVVGSVDKLPMRTTWFFNEYHGHYWNITILSDLYYSDIFDEYGEFCSWDSDGDGMYGENYDDDLPFENDIVDLYPDVHIGRLACDDSKEVDTVVDKIITYETNTYGQSWYNNMLCIGGDTFPGHGGNEGEQLNNMVEQMMTDFTVTKLWTSDGTFNSRAVNRELNKGVGFVDYSGHGFELGVATHPPNDDTWIRYNVFNLPTLINGDKLPIVFFDACLTSKLNYRVSDVNINAQPVSMMPNSVLNIQNSVSVFKGSLLLKSLSKILPISDRLVPCFAWRLLTKANGGAIATIGATETAFGGFDSGAGKLSLEFFSSYEGSETIGEMMSKAQIGYIDDVPYDAFTVEEFVLLGDPSLKIGGYEEDSISQVSFSNSPSNLQSMKTSLNQLLLKIR